MAETAHTTDRTGGKDRGSSVMLVENINRKRGKERRNNLETISVLIIN